MFGRFVDRLGCAITALAMSCGTASAASLGNSEVPIINNGIADFGKGNHANGAPVAKGLVHWDFSPNAAGDLVVTARIDGTLYIDTCLAETVAIRIEYKSSQAGANPLDTRTIPFSGGVAILDGCANASSHKRTINEPFSSPFLREVRITVGEYVSNQIVSPKSQSVFTPDVRSYPNVSINNAPPTFTGGTVTFQRTDNFVKGSVRGKLYWNGSPAGRARIHVQFMDAGNNVLQSFAQENTQTSVPGSINVDFQTTPQVVRGKLFRIRVLLGTGVTINGQQITFNYVERYYDLAGGTSPGTFELSPPDTSVDANSRATLAYTWTVPDPQVWPDLDAMRLRILDGSDVVLSILFDEQSRTFTLVDETTGKLDKAYPAGANKKLNGSHATVHLRDCRVITDGPESLTVTLLLSLSFQPKLSGSMLAVEVAASDDDGNHGAFERAGSITVR